MMRKAGMTPALVSYFGSRGAEEGMEADDILCSRNAQPPKDGKGSLVVLLLAERAR